MLHMRPYRGQHENRPAPGPRPTRRYTTAGSLARHSHVQALAEIR